MTTGASSLDHELTRLLDDIERKATTVTMDIQHARLAGDVPSESGWYTIRTNATLAVLGELHPKPETAHYHIQNRLTRIRSLLDRGFTPTRDSDGYLPVYSGHAKNLKARAQSHLNGHVKTGCLSLDQYAADLRGTQWLFHFTPVSAVADGLEDCEPIRILGEHLWRARFGWPVLCRR